MSTLSPLFTSKCQHGQYRTLKVEYLSPMLVFTKIIVLYNFRYKKLSKPCTQLLRYKQVKTTSPIFTSKCQHGQYRTLKVECFQCRHL